MTLFGTTAKRELLLVSDTIALPVGAFRNVTVPVEVAPPTTLLGFSVTEVTALEMSRNMRPFTVTPPYEAETSTGVVAVTSLVLAVNVALV